MITVNLDFHAKRPGMYGQSDLLLKARRSESRGIWVLNFIESHITMQEWKNTALGMMLRDGRRVKPRRVDVCRPPDSESNQITFIGLVSSENYYRRPRIITSITLGWI